MKKIFLLLFLGCFLNLPMLVQANELDTDTDGLTDWEEQNIYYTDPFQADTDNDGYLDGEEITKHYSPHAQDKTLSQTDLDNDGLSDWLELQFKTNLNNPDTDYDGHNDFDEILNSYDPNNQQPVKLTQKIIIDTRQQLLTATLDNIPLATFPVSTGKKGYETPRGLYTINNKVPRAWSKTYGLWMPYWMSFIGSQYGIHELPEWPGGFKEGQNHLGTPVSHGCVRLGIGPAQWLYNWANIGTSVEVQ